MPVSDPINAQTGTAIDNTTITLNYTLSARGTLVVAVATWDDDSTNITHSGVTYNSVAMTAGPTINEADANFHYRVSLWVLPGVDAVTANIVATVSSLSDTLQIAACYVTGDNELGFSVAPTGVNDSSSPFGHSVTTPSAENLVVSACLCWNDGSITPVDLTNYFNRADAVDGGGQAQFEGAYIQVASAGARATNWTATGDFGAGLVVSAGIAPSTGGGGGSAIPAIQHDYRRRRVA